MPGTIDSAGPGVSLGAPAHELPESQDSLLQTPDSGERKANGGSTRIRDRRRQRFSFREASLSRSSSFAFVDIGVFGAKFT